MKIADIEIGKKYKYRSPYYYKPRRVVRIDYKLDFVWFEQGFGVGSHQVIMPICQRAKQFLIG